MAIIRWEQFKGTTNLRQAMERLFEELMVRSSSVWRELRGGDLRLDMYQTASNVVVKVPLPGVSPEEVDISITRDALTVKGEYKQEKGIKEEDYFQKERRRGAFSRSVTVPVAVKSDKAEAVFDNGVLTLTVPKMEVVRPKQIAVKPGAISEGAKSRKQRISKT